jgi:hypothetical protein
VYSTALSGVILQSIHHTIHIHQQALKFHITQISYSTVTIGGKIFGCLTALTGVIVLAMPTTVIGTNFSDIYEAHYARKREEAAEEGRNLKILQIHREKKITVDQKSLRQTETEF